MLHSGEGESAEWVSWEWHKVEHSMSHKHCKIIFVQIFQNTIWYTILTDMKVIIFSVLNDRYVLI